ncbi:DHA2 family efflux MFS transporter permease subunit [Mycobacterium hodleri]|uniref:DHA2 family efflux MFS transporter permease subunit n=2 Tax=Mycolicibacterium hodleri TaxID=49897 RepID=A0A502DM41_9MYCO|nr:DHA2 family efflux MFS transporter permease subunit [Mycolicibacterium hodleri]
MPPPAKPQRKWMIMAVIGVAQLMVVLDNTIVNIALPSAQADLGFGNDNRQWIITAYALAFGGLLLLGGKLSDLLGRRRTLLIGLLGFAAASAVGGAATGFVMLVAARALQGVFAAVLAPAALSTLNITFTGPKERGKAFGIFSAVASSGAVVGLLLGGVLTEWLSWRWCLYVNLLFAVPAAAGVLAFVAAKETVERRSRLDWPGVITVSGGLFCLVYGLSNAETHGWGAPLTVAMFIASTVLLVSFVVLESKVKAPLLPLRILMDRNRAGSYIAIAFAFCGMFSAFLFLTYYVQQNLGYSPVRTGFAFLPFAAGIALSAGTANTRLVPRFGPRPLIPVGMLVAAGGMFWLSQLTVDTTYLGGVIGPLFILGLGVGMTFAPAIATATTGVNPDDAGVASAMVNTSQQIGGAIGTAALSTIFASAVTRYATSHDQPGSELQATAAVHGYTVAFAVSCGLFLVGAVLTASLLRSGRLQSGPDPSASAPPPNSEVSATTDRMDRVGAARRAPHGPRAAELLGRGINEDGVRLILDLEYRNARLRAENRYLNENLYLRSANGHATSPRPSQPRHAPGSGTNR